MVKVNITTLSLKGEMPISKMSLHVYCRCFLLCWDSAAFQGLRSTHTVAGHFQRMLMP